MRHWCPRTAQRKTARMPQRQQANVHYSQRYFTDGRNLYRFIEWLARSEAGTLAIVEDCRSLAILLVPAERLGATELRPV
jgi:hypothetical protein